MIILWVLLGSKKTRNLAIILFWLDLQIRSLFSSTNDAGLVVGFCGLVFCGSLRRDFPDVWLTATQSIFLIPQARESAHQNFLNTPRDR